jgi:hypothetical protein
LNRYFAETQQIFGAETSVSNFDCLGKTVQTIIVAECGVPEKSSPRQLDDTIKVNHHKPGIHREICFVLQRTEYKTCGKLRKKRKSIRKQSLRKDSGDFI